MEDLTLKTCEWGRENKNTTRLLVKTDLGTSPPPPLKPTASLRYAPHLENTPYGTNRLVLVYTRVRHGLYQRSVYTFPIFLSFGITWYIPGITFFEKLYQVYTKFSKLYQIANSCDRYILCIYLAVYP